MKYIAFLLFLLPSALLAQVPQTPKPATLGTYPGLSTPNSNPTNSLDWVRQRQQQQSLQTRQRNQALMDEVQTNERNRTLRKEIEEGLRPTSYELPSLKHLEGTDLFHTAFSEIEKMLAGEKTLSLKEAVFLTEHAYLGNRLPKDWFDSHVASNVDLIKAALKEEKYSEHNDLAKKMMLHRFMSDTIVLRNGQGEVCNYSTPKRYDFHDIFGKEDWSKMFVSKLMASGSGQCHSMPLLYLILAEELQVEAWLAFSPQHSYVKLKDDKGYWFNLELTNGYYSTDAWIMGSGYVEAEALKHDIYMQPLSKKETIASCLVDLAKGYQHKYGFDSFTLQCIEKALEYDPNNIFALQMKSDYHTLLFHYVVQQLGFPPLAQLPNYPKAYELYIKRNQMYDLIDKVGHEPIPEEVYKDWLKSLEEKKNLQAKFPRA